MELKLFVLQHSRENVSVRTRMLIVLRWKFSICHSVDFTPSTFQNESSKLGITDGSRSSHMLSSTWFLYIFQGLFGCSDLRFRSSCRDSNSSCFSVFV